MPRVLDFADGFESAAEPSAGPLLVSQMKSYVDDTAFEADNGAATIGDFYLNTTTDSTRFYDGTQWRDAVDTDLVQTLINKTLDGDDNTFLDISISSLKTDAGKPDKFISRDGGGAVVDTKDVPTGDVLGTTDTQNLSNKTHADFKLVDGSEGTAGHVLTSIDANGNAQWAAPTGGGGSSTSPIVNHVTGDSFNFEGGSTGNWFRYDDASGSVPIDGTGGSPGFGFQVSVNGPLRGTNNARMQNTGVNHQGEGVGLFFGVDDVDLGKEHEISFNYNSSHANLFTGTNSTIQVFLYDNTGATLIPLQRQTIDSADGTFRARFNASGGSLYRLILHIARPEATFWQFFFDHVVVAPLSAPAPSYPSVGLDLSLTANKTLTNFDEFTSFVAASALTCDLPPLSPYNHGKVFEIQKENNVLAGTITISADGSDVIRERTIETASTVLHTMGEKLVLRGDGFTGKWYVIDRVIPSVWESYTMAVTATTTAPTFNIVSETTMWRRVGDSTEITHSQEHSAGGADGVGTYLFQAVPDIALLTIDSAKIDISTDRDRGNAGSGAVNNNRVAQVSTYDATRVQMAYSDSTSTTQVSDSGAQASLFGQYSFRIVLPITVWNG